MEAAARALGRDVIARPVDVADREQMRSFAEAVHAQAGAVHLLVNNAGVGLGAGLLDTELSDWDWIVAINLMGVVHGCHFFVPPMVERGTGGHVANVSSMAGFHASPGPNRTSTATIPLAKTRMVDESANTRARVMATSARIGPLK